MSVKKICRISDYLHPVCEPVCFDTQTEIQD